MKKSALLAFVFAALVLTSCGSEMETGATTSTTECVRVISGYLGITQTCAEAEANELRIQDEVRACSDEMVRLVYGVLLAATTDSSGATSGARARELAEAGRAYGQNSEKYRAFYRIVESQLPGVLRNPASSFEGAIPFADAECTRIVTATPTTSTRLNN